MLWSKARQWIAPFRQRYVLWALGLGIVALSGGCVTLDDPASIQRLARIASIGSAETVELRQVKPSPLVRLRDSIYQPLPEPTDRHLQILRRYSLDATYAKDRQEAIWGLWKYAQVENSADCAACVASLARQQADYHEKYQQADLAQSWRLLALVSAAEYLWSDRFNRSRNAYDPYFAEATQTYNASLEGLLRHMRSGGNFKKSHLVELDSPWVHLTLTCDTVGLATKDHIERFEFVSDFDITGLTNRHVQHGVGVPLIAVRKKPHGEAVGSEKYYPPGLTIPLTAFVKLSEEKRVDRDKVYINGEIQLIDPLRQKSVSVNGSATPIASDTTAPLAYYLNDPLFRSNLLATASLLDADLGKQVRGLYMLEPYDPTKIPVVMVHGFWSSATTWTEMFNDLRANPMLANRYQFWFYMYPTGQPFWVSAQQMRDDLNEARLQLDPQQQALALDQMVLVGHSMGGLISLLQTVESEDHFWRLVSDEQFDELKGDQTAIDSLRKTLFFSPNHQVKRVVTLATPYHGSDFANPTTRWLGRKLLTLPQLLIKKNQSLIEQNPGFFKDRDLLTIETSVDSLAPDSPFFAALSQAKPAPWTRYHVVVGHLEPENWTDSLEQKLWGEGDGVVELANAELPFADSYDEVNSKHMTVHQHPKSIWIVKQVLLKHLAELAVDAPTIPPSLAPRSSVELVDSPAGNQAQSTDSERISPLVPIRVADRIPPTQESQMSAGTPMSPGSGVLQIHHLHLGDSSEPEDQDNRPNPAPLSLR